MSFRLVGYRLLCRLIKRESLPGLDTTRESPCKLQNFGRIPNSVQVRCHFISYTTDSDIEESFDKFWSARVVPRNTAAREGQSFTNYPKMKPLPPRHTYLLLSKSHTEAGKKRFPLKSDQSCPAQIEDYMF